MINAICGFSMNPEVVGVFDSSMPDEKLPLKNFEIQLSGSSSDVAIALKKMGANPLLLGLIGPPEDDASALLELAVQKFDLEFERLRALDRTSIAFLPADEATRARVAGRRGSVLPGSLPVVLDQIRTHHCENAAWRIGTGVRLDEVPLVLALFEQGEGGRVFTPNWQLMLEENRSALESVIAQTDLLILNEEEHRRCADAIARAFRKNKSLLIVTEGERGGRLSLPAWCARYSAITYPGEQYLPGAGDWFLGGLISALLDADAKIDLITPDTLISAIEFAARVAGKKITMPGAGNGPARREL